MVTVWKCIVQPKLDYCSQLWSPSNQANIAKLENVLRNFTSKIDGCENMDFWDRLTNLRLYSQERRRERYQIILCWKISQGMVDGYSLPFTNNPRRGRLAVISGYQNKAPAVVRNAREASFSVKGAKLFNLMPQGLRDLNSANPDMFKNNLDAFLSGIPDQPTAQGRTRAAVTNSLIDQLNIQTG